MGTFALMMVGLGSIIGSGWLFGAWRVASNRRPCRYLVMVDRDGCYFIYRIVL